jgi:hypothetical protein
VSARSKLWYEPAVCGCRADNSFHETPISKSTNNN